MHPRHHPLRAASRRLGLALAACALALAALPAQSQQSQPTYPSRPIRLIVPIPPGGAPDLIGRAIGQRLSAQMGQPVVIDNKAGSNGQVAAEIAARAPADGYTLIIGMDSLFVINPYLYARSSVDVNKDLVPVATLGANQFVLTVNPGLKVKNLAEFIDLAKRAKPPLAYASGGNGSQHHLTMELLKGRGGFDLLHVPYKGGAPATTATIGGETAVMFAGTSNAALIKAGKLQALATSGRQRSKAMPDVPTIAETLPGFENTIWIGLFAPAGTPQPVLQRLRAEVARALQSPELVDAFHSAGGIEPMPTSPDEMRDLIARDQARYGKIIRDLNVRLD